MSAAKYDVETIMAEVLGVMTANLNTKISEINTEKNDSITLASVDSGAYFFQSLNGQAANFDPFVLYALDDIEEAQENAFSYTITKMKIVVIICIEDVGTNVDVGTRIFRYGRALKEIFEENYELPESRIKLSVRSQVPVATKLLDDSTIHRVVGVTLGAELG